MAAATLTLVAVPGIPLVSTGDDLGAILIAALAGADLVPRDQDVLVIAQKIVSKAEGCTVRLAEVRPSARARELAAAVNKDPRFVELVLSESSEVVRHRRDVLIAAHRLGFVMANAGIDQSNIEHGEDGEQALLLPKDPDGTCAALKQRLDAHFGAHLGIVINDSFGRPWRNGVTGVA
ncbi:MAG TPA: coenzyme F420-0:L-glutamate ligase, partial [Thermoanaerobaculia bacterium]|nr:coenzyme F420-0:L-glutamate ligase [Thermoanaerobaculia bacterium]